MTTLPKTLRPQAWTCTGGDACDSVVHDLPGCCTREGISLLQRRGKEAAALQAILTEVARVRAYGFSERELKYTHDYLLADYESLYVERDQVYAQVCEPLLISRALLD